jgi:hypothetical protein
MFGDGGAGREAKRARMEELARQGRIAQASSETRTKFRDVFSDDYYARELKNFQDAYKPDIKLKYDRAVQNMQAALMQAGLFDSSVRAQKEGMAEEARGDAEKNVTASGLKAQADRKQEVAGAENTVINQLINTADMGAAAENAANAIRTQSSPTPTPMLGQIFTDFSAGLATQADLERNRQNRYSLFGRIPGWSAGGGSRYTRTVGGR